MRDTARRNSLTCWPRHNHRLDHGVAAHAPANELDYVKIFAGAAIGARGASYSRALTIGFVTLSKCCYRGRQRRELDIDIRDWRSTEDDEMFLAAEIRAVDSKEGDRNASGLGARCCDIGWIIRSRCQVVE